MGMGFCCQVDHRVRGDEAGGRAIYDGSCWRDRAGGKRAHYESRLEEEAGPTTEARQGDVQLQSRKAEQVAE